MSRCFGCKESISTVVLTSLVYTWEPVGDNLQEVGWHKNCYTAQQRSQADNCPHGGEHDYAPMTMNGVNWKTCRKCGVPADVRQTHE